jgi:hypothetical protein
MIGHRKAQTIPQLAGLAIQVSWNCHSDHAGNYDQKSAGQRHKIKQYVDKSSQ